MDGGEKIPVTANNRSEYLQRMVHHKLVGTREKQLKAIKRGFWSIPNEIKNILKKLTSVELEFLLCGEQLITPDLLLLCLSFESFPEESKTPEYFKAYVRKLSRVREKPLGLYLPINVYFSLSPAKFGSVREICKTVNYSHNGIKLQNKYIL